MRDVLGTRGSWLDGPSFQLLIAAFHPRMDLMIQRLPDCVILSFGARSMIFKDDRGIPQARGLARLFHKSLDPMVIGVRVMEGDHCSVVSQNLPDPERAQLFFLELGLDRDTKIQFRRPCDLGHVLDEFLDESLAREVMLP